MVAEDDDVITLLDEEGKEHEFSVVDVLDVGGKRYAILQSVSDERDPDTAVIFRMEDDDALVTIEDDAEFERVRQAFEASNDAEADADGEPAGGTADAPAEEHGTTAH